MAEAFVKTFKRDYVYIHDLTDAKTVMELLPLWFEDYNINHPHKGLNMRLPREFRMMQNKLESVLVDGGKSNVLFTFIGYMIHLLANS